MSMPSSQNQKTLCAVTIGSPKPRYGDRFIPSRAGNDWSLNFDVTPNALEISPTNSERKELALNHDPTNLESQSSYKREKPESRPSGERIAYRKTLENEILGNRTDVDQVDHTGAAGGGESLRRNRGHERVSRRLFNYDNTSRQQLSNNGSVFAKSPISTNSESILFHNARTPRKMCLVPYKVLDAPGLLNDFYFTLISVSSRNTLAVCLGDAIYTMQNCQGEVKQLQESMDERQHDDFLGIPSSIAWNQKGNLLAVGTEYGNIHIWDVDANKILKIYRLPHNMSICSVAWNGNNLLTSGSQDGVVWQKDIRAADGHGEVRRYDHDKKKVCKVTWSCESVNLASSGSNGKICIWDIRQKNSLMQMKEHTAAVKGLDWSSRISNLLVSGGGEADKTLRIWNILKGEKSMHQLAMPAQVCNVLWSKLDEELVTSLGYNSNELQVLKYDESKTIKTLATITAHADRVLYMDMLADYECIVTAAPDECVKFWKVFNKSKNASARRSILAGLIR